MLKLISILLTIVFVSQAQAADFQCQGHHDTTDPVTGAVKKVRIDLQVEYDLPAFQRQTGDIADVHFFGQGDKTDNRFLLMITFGPEYTKGVTSSTVWDGKTPIRVTQVNGNEVYRVVCGAK